MNKLMKLNRTLDKCETISDFSEFKKEVKEEIGKDKILD